MRIIPRQTKVTIEFFKNVDLFDVIVGMAGAALAVSAFASNIPGNFYVAGIVAALTVVLIIPIDDIKGYGLVLQILKYVSRPRIFVREEAPIAEQAEPTPAKGKKVKIKVDKKKQKAPQFPPVEDIMGFTAINDGVINYGEKYYAKVLAVDSIEFRFFSEFRQNNIIDKVLGGVIRGVTEDQTMLFVKVDQPVIYDNYIDNEFDKVEQLKESYLNGLIEEDELKIRAEIVFDRVDDILRLNFTDKVFKPYHYVVLCDNEYQRLSEVSRNIEEQLAQGGMPVKLLGTKEIVKFLKYNFTTDFDEREIENLDPSQYLDWIMPRKIEFTTRTVKYDGLITHNLRVIKYPTVVGNAWGHTLFNIPDTKVVMKISTIDRAKSIRNIDRSIDELRSQEQSTGKTSKQIELATHIETLSDLLVLLQSDNEALYDVTLTVTVMDYEQTLLDIERAEQLRQAREAAKLAEAANADTGKGKKGKKNKAPAPSVPAAKKVAVGAKKRIKRVLSEGSFMTTDMFLQQFEAYCCTTVSTSNPIHAQEGQRHTFNLYCGGVSVCVLLFHR